MTDLNLNLTGKLAAPNFFILGAGKCGTTSLYHALKQHPQIHLSSVKEPSFFSPGFQVVSNPVEYFNLFPEQKGKTRYGEASHLHFSTPETAPILRQLFPEAKFILIVRDPVDRAYSLYQHMRRDRFEPLATFEQAVQEEDVRFADPVFRKNSPQYFWNFMYCRSSRYDVQLGRYLEFFPREQFLVLTLGEWIAKPQYWQQQIFRFLEVETGVQIDAEPQNQAVYPELSARSRAAVAKKFEGVRERLEEMAGRKFEHWDYQNKSSELLMSTPPRHHLDDFDFEGTDRAEWRFAGWAIIPRVVAKNGHVEFDGKFVAPFSCGWQRREVVEAFPAECHSENVGFRGHFFVPSGVMPGDHTLDFVFFNEWNEEVGRIRKILTMEQATGNSHPGAKQPEVDQTCSQAPYLDLLENTLLGLPYTLGQESILRQDGKDWPSFAHSMIGHERLHHLRACAETALLENVPGDFIETGVWRGGVCILLRGVLRAHGDTTRKVWVADSFVGLPAPNAQKYPQDHDSTLHTYEALAVSQDQVREHFRRYGLLDDQVKFLKGWFSNTLPNAPVSQLAVLRLDGDMYESTMDALTYLYPKLSPGGYCIIDDYGCIPACRNAVRDYRARHGIHEKMAMIDWTGVWWKKEKPIS